MTYKKEFIIQKLHDYVKEHNRVPSRDQFGYREPIKRLWGTYNNFIQENGYKPNAKFRDEDLTGQVFGRLTVLKKSENQIDGSIHWDCQCSCGNLVRNIRATDLVHRQIQSCGCWQAENYELSRKVNKEKNLKEGTHLKRLNSKPPKNNTSGVRGVSFYKRKGKWAATIIFKGQTHFLGYFDDLEDAKKARLEAEDFYFKPILEKYSLEE